MRRSAFVTIVAGLLLVGNAPCWAQQLTPEEERAVANIKQRGGEVFLLKDGKSAIRWDGLPVTDADLAHLKALKGLFYLNLSRTNVTDNGLVHLADLTKLAELFLDDLQVSDAGLAHLKGLTKLEMLNLNNTKVTGAGLAHLKKMDRLHHLALEEVRLTDAGIAHLKELTGLRHLYLQRTDLTDAGLAQLKDLAQLETLNLDHTKLTDAALPHLKHLTKLRFLFLHDTRITAKALQELKKVNTKLMIDTSSRTMPNEGSPQEQRAMARIKNRGGEVTLKKGQAGKSEVDIRWDTTQVNDSDLAHLKDLTSLVSLDLSRTNVTDHGLIHLKELTQLRNLFLNGTHITDAGLAHLKGLNKLKFLDLGNTKVGDAGIAHLKDLTQIEVLALNGTRLTNAGLVHLKGLARLDSLYLDHTEVNDAGLTHLKGLAQLKTLNLRHTQIEGAGLAQLNRLTKLQTLVLADTRVDDASLVHLKGSKELRGLYIDGTQITGAGLAHLAGFKKLDTLLVNRSKVGDDGLVHLKRLTSLRALDLKDTRVTQKASDELKKTLTRLDRELVGVPSEWTPSVMRHHIIPPWDVEISPDGKRVAFNTGEHLQIVNPDGSNPVRLEWSKILPHDAVAERAVQWSPDGAWLAYATSSEDGARLGRIRVSDGKHEDLFRADKGLRFLPEFKWSPDGQWLAYLATSSPPKNKWTDWLVGEPRPGNTRLYMIPTGADSKGIRMAFQLTPSDYDVGKILERHITFDWSPDSKSIVFSHYPLRRRAPMLWDCELSVANVLTGAVRPLGQTGVAGFAPVFSPDGRWIAFVAGAPSPSWAGNFRVHVVSSAGGAPRPLAETFDKELCRQGGLVGWSADSTKIYYSEAHGTKTRLCALPLDEAPVHISTGEGMLSNIRLNARRNMVSFIWETASQPPEAFVSDLASFKPKRITALNQELLKLPLGRTEVIRWKSSDALEIEGLLTFPVGYEKGKRYPLILDIHGGPMQVFSQSFIGTAYPCPVAAFATRGYAVLRCNVRGSTGYGQQFRFANVGDWGGKDLDDVTTAVDHVIAMGVADPERLGVMGWSYGGYLTAKAITQTKRFKAASFGAGLSNLVSYYENHHEPTFPLAYLGGTPRDKPDFYRERSPVFHLTGVKTPTLIQHGDKDVNVPIGQGHELHKGLKKNGCPVEMHIYRGMAHDPIGESQVIMERNLEWFDRHVKGGK